MRFWIDRGCLQKNSFVIKGDLYRHICHVCKIQKGEGFYLFCEGLQKYEVFLESVSKNQAVAGILKAYPVPPLKKPYLNLAVSLPRLSSFECLIEHSVQLGVKRIQPFLSEFSFFKKKSELKPSRKKRWERIIHQNLALTGRTQKLLIQDLLPLSQICPSSSDQVFIAYESAQKSLKKTLSASKKQAGELWLFLGSEGGFSLRELENFQKNCPQAALFSMGEQILKVETAGLFGLCLLKHYYDL